MSGRIRLTIICIFVFALATFWADPLLGGTSNTAFAFAKLAFEEPSQLLPFEPRISGTTFVASIELVSIVGGTVSVLEDEVVVQVGEHWASFRSGSNQATIDDKPVELAVAVQETTDGFMVPLAALADIMRVSVTWESPYLILTPRFPQTAPTVRLPEPNEAGFEAEVQTAQTQTQNGSQWAGTVSLPSQIRFTGELPANMPGMPLRQSLPLRATHANRLGLPRDIPFQPPEIIRAARVHEIEVVWGGSDLGSREIRIEASEPFSIDAFLMEVPSQLVLDLHGLDTGNAKTPMMVKDTNVRAIRLGQFTPDTVRIVAELEHVVGYTIQTSEDGRQATIRIYHALRNMDAEFSASGGALHLDIPSGAAVELIRLSDPERIAIDLPETTLVGAERRIQGDGGPVEFIWASRHDRDRTRITLYVERYLDLIVDRQGDTLSFQAAHRIEDIGYAEFDFGFVAVFHGTKLPEPRIMSLMADSVHTERLVVDFPGTVFVPGETQVPLSDSALAWQLRTGQDASRMRFVLDLQGKIDHVVVPLGEEAGYAIVAQYPSLAGTNVLIDPGHGGPFSGAVGANLGLLEKDVNLNVALRLGQLLEAADTEVHYTRTGDTTLNSTLERDLALRQQMATELGVDLFVSIHANSVEGNPAGAGTETYIHSSIVHPEAIRLAGAVQRELVATGGRYDRGVKEAAFRVIRNATVPSILVELAFLSNAEEEQLLGNPAFQQRLAQGIFHGLVSYVREQSPDGEVEDADKLETYQTMIEGKLADNAFTYLSHLEGETNADGQ